MARMFSSFASNGTQAAIMRRCPVCGAQRVPGGRREPPCNSSNGRANTWTRHPCRKNEWQSGMRSRGVFCMRAHYRIFQGSKWPEDQSRVKSHLQTNRAILLSSSPRPTLGRSPPGQPGKTTNVAPEANAVLASFYGQWSPAVRSRENPAFPHLLLPSMRSSLLLSFCGLAVALGAHSQVS